MLQRGLSRITETEVFDLAGNVTSIEAGAPVAGIFNNSKLKLEAAATADVDNTLEHWQFLGFAFNKYCSPSNAKFHNFEVKAVADGDKASIEVPADLFDSTTTNLQFWENTGNGKTAISTKVSTKPEIAGATNYYLDSANNKVFFDASLADLVITVQYSTVLSAYAAKLSNQFGPDIFTSIENSVTVITEAQVIAIDSKFVNAAGYIAAGVYNKTPACYLTKAANNEFVITVGGSTGNALKNLLFLGFKGDSALFKLTPNSNLI